MTTILLEKNRKENRRKYLLSFLTKVVWSLVSVLFVWLIFEATIYYMVDGEKSVLEKVSREQGQKEKNDLVSEYKKNLKEADDIVYLFDLSNKSKDEVLDFILDKKTENIKIDFVSIETGEESTFVGVAGVAETRDGLSEFKQILEDSPNVSGVDLPISSFTKTFDIPFSITFVYKYE